VILTDFFENVKPFSFTSFIKNMHHKGNLPRIHGWIYAMESGQLNVLVNRREPK
jgi:carbonic anhydrase